MAECRAKNNVIFRRMCFVKGSLVVLNVLCCLGGTTDATGTGKQIIEPLEHRNKAGMQQSRSLLPKYSEPVKFKTAAVAADYKNCSERGAEILRDHHGNAVDAAIATALCVGVVNAHSAGIGGGGFMIIHDKKRGSYFFAAKTTAINFREVVSHHENAETMKDFLNLKKKWKERERKKNIAGEGEFIGVPGELRGFEMAWKKYGRLPWRKLFQPAIEIATNGFPANHALVNAVRINWLNVTHDFGLRELFRKNGRKIKEGDVIKRTKYGKTLRKIADSGADLFYTGKMAKKIVKDVRSIGSCISLTDLKDYRATEVKPLEVSLPGVKGYKLLTVPPPAGGAALINILSILKGFNFSANDMKHHPVLTYHRMIEAFNFVAAKQTYLTDPVFDEDVKEVVKEMLDPERSEQIRRLINGETHSFDYYGPINYNTDITDGTTHVSVLDAEENAVSLTTSINKYFGAKLRSPKLGIIYNDQLLDTYENVRLKEFKLAIDELKPYKRPVSLASPSIILDEAGDVKMVFGAAGGKYIATALAQVLMNHFWFGESLRDAVSKSRLHSQLFPNLVLVEKDFPKQYIDELKRFGHKITNDTVKITGTPFQIVGVVQLVYREKDGEILALADHRKGGGPAGYR
ncbi:glutathione hydrolase 1 proenzyme-like isoform X1 [Pocillopora damicornis]|uniref:glutathione hydrolase 1 proenzyme-like isoform X1 n=1 Tax=Pocillopora damicornis TaxID=46731 RepID=UPI000F556BEA|nr:glutathione hydrolase 1 proenzyme-like isoform X1 [Pocillopora damicornis]